MINLGKLVWRAVFLTVCLPAWAHFDLDHAQPLVYQGYPDYRPPELSAPRFRASVQAWFAWLDEQEAAQHALPADASALDEKQPLYQGESVQASRSQSFPPPSSRDVQALETPLEGDVRLSPAEIETLTQHVALLDTVIELPRWYEEGSVVHQEGVEWSREETVVEGALFSVPFS